ncbi:MAG TPA: SEC59/DGK1/VTE5 family protein [Bacteroidota bacterium]|nr:SEC59/DGK1/VTE5 family protein [Bacteroidota bacterium]
MAESPKRNGAPSGDPESQQTVNEHLEHSATIDFRSELIRKAIHLSSLSIPLIYYQITKELALQLLVPLTVAFITVDLARYYHQPIADWFYRWFGWLLRRHEQDEKRKRLNGATNVLIAATLCVLIFPKILVVTALTILIFSDSTSALIGRRFGKHRFLGKSLEGTFAFFVTAVLVVLATPKVDGLPMEYVIGIIAAAVGALAEASIPYIDDNLTVPISICSTMWGLYALLLPTVDLFRIV